MKKTFSALAGLSLMVTPIASATASVRPAVAIPTMASSAYVVQDDDESDDDELFILAVMGAALVLAAIVVFNKDSEPQFPEPPISGA